MIKELTKLKLQRTRIDSLMRKMKTIIAETILRLFEEYLFSKYSGIVEALRYFEMILVRFPKISQASAEPINAFPTPIHAADTP